MRTIIASLLFILGGGVVAQETAPLISRIKAVGREGAGNPEAAQAWRDLVRQGPNALLDILAGMQGASPQAINWLRSAVETIADAEQTAGRKLPADKLETFVKDTRQHPRARRLAYELLVRVDTTAPDRLLPGMLDDPGQELRRDAVAVLLDQAQKRLEAQDETAARDLFKKSLHHARDKDQVALAAERLRKLDVEVDLTRHFGFITQWSLVGPFDNVKGVGFNTVFPPEAGVNLKDTYVGKQNQKVSWIEYAAEEKPGKGSLEELGLIDLNKAIGKLKGATFFAHTVVESKVERPVEIRAGSNNAIRIFLNGKEIYFREEYHHGMRMDQHIGKGTLRAGKNEILVKVCQNEQTEPWAQLWSFQLRICDELGAAVPVTVAK